MKFKATASQIESEEARAISRRVLNKRAGSGSKWKPPSPRHCTSYGCEELQTHDVVLRNYYRNGESKRIGYCVTHAYSVKKILGNYKEGLYVERRAQVIV